MCEESGRVFALREERLVSAQRLLQRETPNHLHDSEVLGGLYKIDDFGWRRCFAEDERADFYRADLRIIYAKTDRVLISHTRDDVRSDEVPAYSDFPMKAFIWFGVLLLGKVAD
jgi:hypothetical protein